jgi:hypothetical protein
MNLSSGPPVVLSVQKKEKMFKNYPETASPKQLCKSCHFLLRQNFAMDLTSFEVTDWNSFMKFLNLFHQDLLNNKAEWKNKPLEDFLEAFIFYIKDIQVYYDNSNQEINADSASWKVFADLFKGAKMYE